MSYGTEQKIVMSPPSVLRSYFSSGSHTIKDDLNSFRAFLLHVKYQYKDRVEIPRTVIKLLHMYHPQDGYESYMKLVNVICVLLEELDRDSLRYLLSIIPPPNTPDKESIEEEVRQVAGFSLLSISAFQTLVLPVLNNTASVSHQEGAPDTKPVNMVEMLKPQDDFHTESLEIPHTAETQNSLNSDNDSIIAEPKLQNYELYEAVGDLSESILNEIFKRAEDSKTSKYKNVKDIFYLESLMLPSALKMSELGSLSDCSEEEKQKTQAKETKKPLSACDLTLDPFLEKSVKNFIAITCSLLPSTPYGNPKNERQDKNKFVTKENKKNMCNGTKVKDLKAVPEERKSLIDELAHTQKKPLLSYLITPLDPASDDADPVEEMHDTIDVSSLPTIAERDTDSKKYAQVKTYMDMIHPEPDALEEDEPDNESKTDNKKSETDKKKRKETDNRKSSKYDSKTSTSDGSQVVCDIEYIMDASPSSTREKGILTGTLVKPEVLPSAPHLISTSDLEQQIMPLEVTDDLSVITCEIVAATSKDGRPSAETNHNVKKTEENIMTEIQTFGKKKEYVTDPTIMDHSCKNLDLELNRENMKLSGITVPDETCVSGSDVQLADNSDTIDKSLSSLQKSEVLSYKPSVPISHGFSAYKSHTHASDLHEFAAVKCSEQNTEPSVASINANSRDLQPPSVNSKLPCTLSEAPVLRPVPRYQIVQFPVPTSVTQHLGCHERAVGLSNSQAVSQSANTRRTWTEYSREFDPHHPLNIRKRSVDTSYESVAEYQTLQNNWHWMMRPSGSMQQVQQLPWGGFPGYGQYPALRELAQQNVRFAQRAAFPHQVSPSVNSYLDPARTLIMNGLWGSYNPVSPGLYARTTEASTLLPDLPPSSYPMNDPSRLHQHLHATAPGPFPNHAEFVVTRHSSAVQQPSQTKRRKLEEIVGRLKEAEKTT